MVNYNNSIIYKLCCKDVTITDIYVGSTTNFIQRKRAHKNSCFNENNKKYNFNVYRFIREHGGWCNWSMVQIENYNCENKRELETRERYWFEELKAKLNSKFPSRTRKEYRENNKKIIKEKKREYNENNKEIVQEYSKEYYEKNKGKAKEYYEINKQKLLETAKQKVNCDICNKRINKSSIARHKRTQHNIIQTE